nr:sulfatase-like hydrolase/transferase [uncultured Porphyromonas sp.]
MNYWRPIKEFLLRGEQRTYYWIFTLSLLLPNVILSVVMQQPMIGRVLNILLMLPLYMLVMLVAKRPGRVYWSLLVLVLLHMFQLVLLTIFSGSVVAVDMILNLFTSEPDEATELLSNILWPILGSLALYVPVLILATFSARNRKVLSAPFRRRTALSALGLLIVALPVYIGAKQRFPYLHLRAEVYPMSVFYNMYLATKKLRQVYRYTYTSETFSYGATSERPSEEREVYVLVLGETSRAHSWSLYGYARPTTPRLDTMSREGLIPFADVLTQSNTTYKSIPIILSPADAASAEELPRVRGILEAYKEAGFYTAFVSNQPGNHSYVDFFAMQGDEYHSIRKELRHGKRRLYDSDMLPYLKRLLASDHPRLFIVLHTYGAHFSYRDRYPKDVAPFPVPRRYSGAAKDSLALRSAYDNAIWQTDRFVDEVIRLLGAQDRRAALLYVSDHGEDVYDDSRERFLHSSPDVSYYQLHVPLLLWLSPSYRQVHPELTEAARANQRRAASTNTVFHTLLQLSGIRTRYRRDSLSLVSPTFLEQQRYYLNDRYECLPIEQLDLSQIDVELFHQKGLRYDAKEGN